MISLKYKKQSKQNAVCLRRTMTPEKRKLWYDYLRQYPYQFRRQKPFGTYVVDFYCAQAKMVVELDGEYHRTTEVWEKDEKRTAYLNSLGLEVLRFPNEEVRNRFSDVCARIDWMVKERIKGQRTY